MPSDNNSAQDKQEIFSTAKIVRYLAAFENCSIPDNPKESVVLVLEDTSFIADFFEGRGYIVDRAKWDDNTPPHSFVLNYLTLLYEGYQIQAILLDHDLNQGELTGATIAGWIREAEAFLGLAPVLVVANSASNNQAIMDKAQSNVVSCSGNKMAYFTGQLSQPIQLSKVGHFASQTAGHDAQRGPRLGA